VISVLFTFSLVYVIFRLGGFGGADAKALVAIAIMFPANPSIGLAGLSFPVAGNGLSPVFALTVLGNAIALTGVVPSGVLVYNLLTAPAAEIVSNPVGAIAGYRVPVGRPGGKHLRLMHQYGEAGDRIERRLAFKGPVLDDDMRARLARWQAEGRIGDHVWVTPQLPFLIPIALGFLTAVVYGDILVQLISILLGR